MLISPIFDSVRDAQSYGLPSLPQSHAPFSKSELVVPASKGGSRSKPSSRRNSRSGVLSADQSPGMRRRSASTLGPIKGLASGSGGHRDRKDRRSRSPLSGIGEAGSDAGSDAGGTSPRSSRKRSRRRRSARVDNASADGGKEKVKGKGKGKGKEKGKGKGKKKGNRTKDKDKGKGKGDQDASFADSSRRVKSLPSVHNHVRAGNGDAGSGGSGSASTVSTVGSSTAVLFTSSSSSASASLPPSAKRRNSAQVSGTEAVDAKVRESSSSSSSSSDMEELLSSGDGGAPEIPPSMPAPESPALPSGQGAAPSASSSDDSFLFDDS